MRPRPTPERLAEIRDWMTNIIPNQVYEAHLMEMGQDLLAEIDALRAPVWHVFSCRMGINPCDCVARFPDRQTTLRKYKDHHDKIHPYCGASCPDQS